MFPRSADEVARLAATVPELTYPGELPIAEHRTVLLEALAAHQVVIVAGETGSGKSTQLPKLCLELGRGLHGLIGHTQPRRVAARTIAERVASEIGRPLGSTVGYAVRFTDRVGDDTLVKVMTDGLLLAEIQRDRTLRRYDTIIVDEAHERSLNIDFLLGYLTHLLPRRPDLKLIVTSATLDTEQFSRHFGGAPVVTVSGRTYPVEVRYQPYGEDPDDDRDQVGAIADAVDELMHEGPGDVLVFCSGEREIHDAADFLRRSELRDTEVLALYARMSAQEQHRVFEPHAGRRVILATNVAETSLTVPGVRYVVDAGTARISRYSRRLKVQRLPIEPISQASAGQRAGRCGRVGPGICIRLYSEADFLGRPEFTEPEILRTSLASVILQMAALGLGDVASFPFVEPPDARAVADGVALLDELGAFEPLPDGAPPGQQRRLTKRGRRLAQLPVDPRLGRMILESDRLGCAREVLVIAAALSIQDPRERPQAPGVAEAATQAHARFTGDDGSDFMAFVRLWDHLRAQQRALTGNQFRRLCRSEYLNYLRVREWQDLYSQLRQIAGGIGVRINHEPAHPDHVHQALLSGLLSQLGMRDGESKEFRGARGARFMVARGSAQFRRPAKWVMAAELMETNRLWARVVARVQPEWAERLGEHLVKRSYGEPEWDDVQGAATTIERVSLYGLPIVAGRRVLLGRIDPALARALFIRHALVQGDWEWERPHRFLDHNASVIAELEALAERTRRGDLAPDDDRIEDAYAARIPDDVTSVRHFERWWRDERTRHPHLLDLSREDLAGPAGLDLDEFPEAWEAHEPPLPLTYGFDPGREDDGITVTVPLATLNEMDPSPFDWLVPGLRQELIAAYVKGLPKVLRRHLIPAAEHVARATEALRDGPGPASTDSAGPVGFRSALAAQLSAQCGERIDPAFLDPETLPAHLRVTFAVTATDGTVVASGKDLRSLQKQLRPAVRDEVARLLGIVELTGLTDWTFGPLAESAEATQDGYTVRGYPALIDDGTAVQLRVLTTAEAAARATRRGVHRLLLTSLPLPRKACAQQLDNRARLALARLGWRSAVDLVDDVVTASVIHLADSDAPVPPRDEQGFRALQASVAARLPALAVEVMRQAVRAVVAAAATADRLAGTGAPAFAGAVADAEAQRAALVHPGFVTATGVERLRDLPRYLQGIDHRLAKLADKPGRDADLMTRARRLEAEYRSAVDAAASRGASTQTRDQLARIRWLLEELRVSLFAQTLGTAEPVSERRLVAELAAITVGS